MTWKPRRCSLFVTLAAVLLAVHLRAEDGPASKILLPPAGSLYHGVYPGGVTGEEDDLLPADLAGYEAAAGKTAAWVYFSHNWFHGRAFPLATARWIRQAGSVPYLRLMLRSSCEQDQAEPIYTLDRIISGDFDADLRAWARAARDFRSALLAEYGTEMNGSWFSWNGQWNGGGQTGGYGDPARPDGPERFVDAFRHIVGLCREEGALNITWVFHVNGNDWPDEDWNRLERYYPGDEWVDWLGVSIYGAQTPQDEGWPAFRDTMDAVYPRLRALAPGKPVIVAEFGATSGNPLGQPGPWAGAALADLSSFRWGAVIGFSWWNERWENDDIPSHDTDMRIQDDPGLSAAFLAWAGGGADVLGRARSTGDLDFNGHADAADLVRIASFLAASASAGEGFPRVADLDGDGRVGLLDLVHLAVVAAAGRP